MSREAKTSGLLARLRGMRAASRAPSERPRAPSDSGSVTVEDEHLPSMAAYDSYRGRRPASNESYMTLPPNATRFDTHISSGSSRPPSSQPMSSGSTFFGLHVADNESYMTLPRNSSRFDTHISMGSSRAPSSQPMSSGSTFFGLHVAGNESYMTLPRTSSRFDTRILMEASPPPSTQHENEPTLWFDTRPTAKPYVPDSDNASTASSHHTRSGPIRDTQMSYKRRASGLGGPNTQGDMSYESAFRLIQHAIDAERNADPLLAIQLYSDASELLARAGKNEADLLLRQAVQEKALVTMKRAEELDKWYYSLQEHIRKAALPPQPSVQRTSIPRVHETWQGRRPPYWQHEQFTNMRYTAVTTRDPSHFSEGGYQLRVDELQRKIRTLILVTVNDEDGSDLERTLTSIARNLQYMCDLWGEKAWENVAVIILSDGRSNTSTSCLGYLNGIGAFDEEVMTVTSVGVDVHLHLFESTVQLVCEDNPETYYPPVQLIYGLKEQNKGQLHSHLWFFSAFAERLLPVYTVFVDVGTSPERSAIFRLIRTMDRDHHIGGVAGEIIVEQPNFLNPVVAAQHFVHKFSNIMDKSLESVCGYVSAPPEALTAFRYEAIRAESGEGPLHEYFFCSVAGSSQDQALERRMFLNQDRILSFELLARTGRNWTMRYVKDAIAYVYAPKTLSDTLTMRMRRLDSVFFGGLFVLSNFGRVWMRSGHSFPRKCLLSLQFVFLFVQSILDWFLLSNLFLAIYYVLTLTLHENVRGLLQGMLGVYVGLVIGTVVFALGNRPEKRSAVFFSFSAVYFGVVILAVFFISMHRVLANLGVKDPRNGLPSCTVNDTELKGVVITTLGLLFAPGFLQGEFSLIFGAFQFLFMIPTYVNILSVYTYCNLHSLSDAPKGSESPVGTAKVSKPGKLKEIITQQKHVEVERQRVIKDKDNLENSLLALRSTIVLSWLATNAAWAYAMTSYMSTSCYLIGFAYVALILTATRSLGSTIYFISRFCQRFHRSSSDDSLDQHDLSTGWQPFASGTNSQSRSSSSQIKIDMRAVLSPTTGFRELTL